MRCNGAIQIHCHAAGKRKDRIRAERSYQVNGVTCNIMLHGYNGFQNHSVILSLYCIKGKSNDNFELSG
jgi:hypothetical protein